MDFLVQLDHRREIGRLENLNMAVRIPSSGTLIERASALAGIREAGVPDAAVELMIAVRLRHIRFVGSGRLRPSILRLPFRPERESRLS